MEVSRGGGPDYHLSSPRLTSNSIDKECFVTPRPGPSTRVSPKKTGDTITKSRGTVFVAGVVTYIDDQLGGRNTRPTEPSRVAEHWDFTCDPDTMDISLPQTEAEEIADKVRRMTDKKAGSTSKTPQGTSA